MPTSNPRIQTEANSEVLALRPAAVVPLRVPPAQTPPAPRFIRLPSRTRHSLEAPALPPRRTLAGQAPEIAPAVWVGGGDPFDRLTRLLREIVMDEVARRAAAFAGREERGWR